MKNFILTLCASSLILSLPCHAQVSPEKKSLFWTPLVNIFLPGLGQALDNETKKSMLLSGVAFTGFLIAADGYEKQQQYLQGTVPDYNHYEDNEVQQRVGNSMYLQAGLMSAYDTFNSRVKAYQAEGRYQFLPKEQNALDLLKAPFHFSYMKRATTWIPFLLSLGLSYDYLMNNDENNKVHVHGGDVAAGLYLSYNAGTGEEAYFRGVFHPTLYESWNGSWLANAAQGLVFGYMHGPAPYPQILAGWYLGWLSERNGFDLGENVFIHAWWDVWVLTAHLIRNRSNANNVYIQLPSFSMRF